MIFGDVVILNKPFPDFISNFMNSKLGNSDKPAMLNLRLVIQDEDVGELIIFNESDVAFTTEHTRLLQSVREPVAIAMSNARRYQELKNLKDILIDDNRAMRHEFENLSGNQVVGADFGLKHVMEMVHQISSLNNPVLLLGETGTGKEVIAHAIHRTSPRHESPMIRVQCGAIPDSLLNSELFGHEKGAFTGALSQKRGRFERANGGTIFLDEIGELTLDAQVKLLHVLQEHEIERLGGNKTIQVNVRVIAATHRNLEKMVENGTFREDLWYRLNVFPIRLPPLRERKEDIQMLTTYFINSKSRELGLETVPFILPEAIAQLKEYRWPGNVRELQNIVERALITSRGDRLVFPELGSSEDKPQHRSMRGEKREIAVLETVIKDHITFALNESRGKIEGKGGAADMLAINPSTLRARMRKLNIPFGKNIETF